MSSHPRLLTMGDLQLEYAPASGQLRLDSDGGSLVLACQGMVEGADGFAGADPGTVWSRPEPTAEGGWAFRALSTRWEEKLLLVGLDAGGLTLRLQVRGHGPVGNVVFAAGVPAGFPAESGSTLRHLAWARRERSRSWSGSPLLHRRVFNPQPDGYGEQELPATCGQRVTCATTFGPDRFNTFFAPPLQALIFDQSWCLGLESEPGQAGYTHLDYVVGAGWGLMLHFDGHTQVDGEWISPAIRIAPCRDAETGLRSFVRHLRATGRAPRRGSPPPDWIRRPILCTWGQQTVWAHQAERGVAPPFGSPATPGANGFASEAGCAEIVRLAEAADLPFGVLTIDAGWSSCQCIPEPDLMKWNDLKGFIAAQHAQGRRVLLWLAAWNATGLHASQRMPHDPGLPDLCDPTNPLFRARLRRAVEHCISPQGLDADGFKVDYTGDMPRGPGYHPDRPGLWGQDLLRSYLGLIHAAMKNAKEDSVLQTHCASPYFADLTECLRLNDVFGPQADVREAMGFRARMAVIANPEAAIDSDCDPFSDRDAWLEYLRFQIGLGAPSIHSLSHMDFPGADGSLQEIRPGDLAEVARLWQGYLERSGGPLALVAGG